MNEGKTAGHTDIEFMISKLKKKNVSKPSLKVCIRNDVRLNLGEINVVPANQLRIGQYGIFL